MMSKEIKNDAAQFVIAIMKTYKILFERCPLDSMVIRKADVFDPNYMLNESSATLLRLNYRNYYIIWYR